MTNFEKTQHAIETLKSCPVSEVTKAVLDFVSAMLTISAKEKTQCGEEFYSWAKSKNNSEPLKLFYAEFLLGLCDHLCERHERALQHFTSGRKQFEEYGDGEGAALCAILIGSVYLTFGNFELTLKTCWEGYEGLRNTTHFTFFLCGCTNSMAKVNFELHNYEEAAKWFNECYQVSDKIDFDYFRVYSLQGLGKVSMTLHKTDEAKKYFERAVQIAEASNNSTSISNALTELADFYFQTGTYTEAEKLSNDSLLIREKNNYAGGAITNCIQLANIFIKQLRWDDAMKILEKGLTMAEQLKVRPKIYQVHLLLSKVFREKGNLEKALWHYEQFHEIREQVEKEDYARKLSDARLIFDAEQTRKENIIIKKQKAEIQKKNIELQDTIDELTITKISRKAKALTLIIAIALFVLEDTILHYAMNIVSEDSYLISMMVKLVIIFSLKPIEDFIEKYLVKKVIRRKRKIMDIGEEAKIGTA